MRGRSILTWRDYFFLLVVVVFLFGCVASSHRSGKTLDQGQFSAGLAWDGLMNLEESEADMIQLVQVDGRVGVVRGFDIGAAHTWDVTDGNDGLFSTWWGDAKFQVTNRENRLGEPIVSLGLLKGYVYHEDADTHITSFPVTVSIPVNETTTPYFMYRLEDIHDDFIPTQWDAIRHGFIMGAEIELASEGSFTPVFGLDIGLMTDLYGGEDGDMMLVLNAGMSFNSPSK